MDGHRPSPLSTLSPGTPPVDDRRPAGTPALTATDGERASADASVEIGRRIQLGLVASDQETLLRGRRAYQQGDDRAALECFSRLTAHGLRYADVYYMIAMVKERRGEIDAALDALREATRINPAYVEALLALASLHEQRGDFDRSRGFAERASQLARPTNGGLDATTRAKLSNQQAALADALAAAGELREAIEEYRRALERCPTFHDVRHRLGVVLREAGLPAQAAGEFQQILRMRPGLLESRIQLGLTFYSMGRTPEAIREWNAVLEQDPSRDTARMYLRLMGAHRRATEPSETSARNLSEADGTETTREAASPRPARPQDPLPADPESPVAGWTTTELVSPPDELLE